MPDIASNEIIFYSFVTAVMMTAAAAAAPTVVLGIDKSHNKHLNGFASSNWILITGATDRSLSHLFNHFKKKLCDNLFCSHSRLTAHRSHTVCTKRFQVIFIFR